MTSYAVPETVSPTSVHTLREVQYAAPGVGHFPLLSADGATSHGFTWGETSENMSYRQHDGDPDIIVQRNRQFLGARGMNASRVVIIEGCTEPQLIDVNPTYLSITPSSERGYFAPVYALFTKLRKQPLAIKPGDCSSVLLSGKTGDGEPLVGIIHATRGELSARLPIAAMQHIEKTYGCDPARTNIGLLPSISAENHAIWAEYIDDHIDDFEEWDGYLKYDEEGTAYLDAPGLGIKQFVEAGVRPENIELYDVDTYTAARKGEAFSHRYTTHTGQRPGRFMTAIQIN